MKEDPFKGVFIDPETLSTLLPVDREKKRELEKKGYVFPSEWFVESIVDFLNSYKFKEDSIYSRIEAESINKDRYRIYIYVYFFTSKEHTFPKSRYICDLKLRLGRPVEEYTFVINDYLIHRNGAYRYVLKEEAIHVRETFVEVFHDFLRNY